MDAKYVLFLIVMVLGLCIRTDARVVFNIQEKLRMATTTEESLTQHSQIIRVPELECPIGQRRDKLGNCRQRF